MRKFYSRALLGALVGGGFGRPRMRHRQCRRRLGNGRSALGRPGRDLGRPARHHRGNAVSVIGDSHSEDADTSAPARMPPR